MDDAIGRLKSAAQDRWEDKWTVEVKHWSDGSYQYYAYHIDGRTADGVRIEERLLFGTDGKLHHERRILEAEELIDRQVVESPIEES